METGRDLGMRRDVVVKNVIRENLSGEVTVELTLEHEKKLILSWKGIRRISPPPKKKILWWGGA